MDTIFDCRKVLIGPLQPAQLDLDYILSFGRGLVPLPLCVIFFFFALGFVATHPDIFLIKDVAGCLAQRLDQLSAKPSSDLLTEIDYKLKLLFEDGLKNAEKGAKEPSVEPEIISKAKASMALKN